MVPIHNIDYTIKTYGASKVIGENDHAHLQSITSELLAVILILIDKCSGSVGILCFKDIRVQEEGSIEENSREYGHVGVTSHVTVK